MHSSPLLCPSSYLGNRCHGFCVRMMEGAMTPASHHGSPPPITAPQPSPTRPHPFLLVGAKSCRELTLHGHLASSPSHLHAALVSALSPERIQSLCLPHVLARQPVPSGSPPPLPLPCPKFSLAMSRSQHQSPGLSKAWQLLGQLPRRPLPSRSPDSQPR
mgnify:CR=1 FL=1